MSIFAANVKLAISTLVVAALLSAAVNAAARERSRGAETGGASAQMPPRDSVSPNPLTATMRRSTSAVQQMLTNGQVNSAFQMRGALRDPKTRALVTASLATAVLARGADASWRHRGGGYGWVGPVFWPFASYDMMNYVLWGDRFDNTFWDYGYGDLHAGLFGPYAYDTLTGYAHYLPRPDAANSSEMTLARLCGEDSRDVAGLPPDAFQNAIQPTDVQRAALDDFIDASQRASRLLKAACPATIALTAAARLAVMQQRVGAMIAAVRMVQPRLEKFYVTLNDEQKAQLASAQPASQPPISAAATPLCAAEQPGQTNWPKTAIKTAIKGAVETERSITPTDAQKKSLDGLKAAAGRAVDILKASCQPGDALTPPARLAAVGKRLDTMLEALNTVTVALDGFSSSLDGAQAADFNQIGSPPASPMPQMAAAQQKVSTAEQADAPRASRRRHVRHARQFPHPVRVIGRMLFSFVR